MAVDPLVAPAVSVVFVCHDADSRVLLARRSLRLEERP
jgi:ABC-type nitrate/sulfonate/bicarbonate transport system ATPase subunit